MLSLNRIIYVLTSTGCDIYSAMTRLSVASIRLTNPSIRVAIACDQETDSALVANGDRVRSEVDEWLVFETPVGEPMFRNRFIKTNLRNLVDGPFLFLDSDTIVRKDIGTIFACDADLAGAPNHSADQFTDQLWEEDEAHLATMGWEIDRNVYINGGVLFYRDSDNAHRLTTVWHTLWLTSIKATSRLRDQPALNAACFETKPRLAILDTCYNAQVSIKPHTARTAAVWHYYATRGMTDMWIFHALISTAQQNKCISRAHLQRVIASDSPFGMAFWTSVNGRRFIDNTVLSLCQSRTFCTDIQRLYALDRNATRLVSITVLKRALIHCNKYTCFRIFALLLCSQIYQFLNRVLLLLLPKPGKAIVVPSVK